MFVICNFTFNDVSEPLFLSYISNIFTMFTTVVVHAPPNSLLSNFLFMCNFQY